ncbi:SDR family NAD(P)-dependent oxidoreductase [Paramicrobacterium sp. CJ85]|uniref:SDR family NAD(P)-dependent oxidoreductase n=1 Tax=Paramicrobacterium sp. CJ85 TaxID=3445355 RepID=UPI003F63D11A
MTTALITGGNRGLGRAVAEELANRGMTVVIGARSASDGARAAEEIGRGATSVQMDVTDAASVRAAAAAVEERHGGLDVLINNAGVLPEATSQPTEVVDLALFQQTYATNVFGAVAVLEAFLPQLTNAANGRIVNVSTAMGSLADQTNPASPYYGMVVPAYQSSKAALNGITIALAKALADTATLPEGAHSGTFVDSSGPVPW